MSELINQSNLFAVHLLSSKQIPQSIAFSSTKTQSDFTPFPHFYERNLPILQGSLSVLLCKIERKAVLGSHEVFYGLVEKVLPDGIHKNVQGNGLASYSPLKPLLYFDSSYRSVGDEVFIEAFENTSLAFSDWTHRAHLRMAWIYLKAKDEHSHDVIRNGIKEYNRANAHLINHGYNETITTFFCNLVELALEEETRLGYKDNDDFMEFLGRYPSLDHFSIILKFYSKDLLYSDLSKRVFQSPDLRANPQHIQDILHHS
ncbi:hypothetical protein HDV02_003570 [Globomyces sp. JEL0801]|nr:hypothetical protein HDV02_003570 [Globomyces sp. JEL0801]